MTYPDKPATGALLHWRDGAVAHIRFNRPQALNAVNIDVAQGFLRACQDIAADRQVRVVWMSAEGRAFLAGGDLASMRDDPVAVSEALILPLHEALQLLDGLDAPVVASVQGAVAGGGLGLLLGGADIIVAAEDARFGVAYPLIGASCDCSTSWSLPRRVGLHRALELALLGDAINASQALTLGLCNTVVAAAELESHTRSIVERLATGPTRSYGQIRRLIRQSLESDLAEQLDAEAAGFLHCAATRDFEEGIAAFLEKRPPVFEGR